MYIPAEVRDYLDLVEEPRGTVHIKCRLCNTLFFSLKDAVRHLAMYHRVRIDTVEDTARRVRVRRRRKK
ncbi:MAG: hypothetical protein GXO26_04555 [Crenarchaeota archaeon]|nr:hypothetical protein [Thermoproteota archaeon]